VHGKGFTDDVADRHTGIERAERVLKDQLHVAAQRAKLSARQAKYIFTIEKDLTAGSGYQAQDSSADGGFAAAGFADQAESFAGFDFETDAIDRFYPIDDAAEDSLADGKIGFEIINYYQAVIFHLLTTKTPR